MRAARMIVSYDVVARAIGLPTGNEVIAIGPQTADEVFSRCFSVVVSGDDMPKHPEGAPLQVVSPPF